MGKTEKRKFAPQYAVHPGEILLDVLANHGITQTELAERTGTHKKTITSIIRGNQALTADMAVRLERVFDVGADFWTRAQALYDTRKAELELRKEYEQWPDWPMQFPYPKMAKEGWVEQTRDRFEKTRNLLQLFGCATINAWQEMFENIVRKRLCHRYRQTGTNKIDEFALFSWLARGENIARKIDCMDFSKSRLRKLLIEEIRPLTRRPDKRTFPFLVERFAACGVALTFVESLPGIRANGACRWIAGNPMIQLNDRYKTDDQFWFTLFHEAAHVLRHLNKKEILVEELDQKESKEEAEANEFAAETLIPKKELDLFISRNPRITKGRVRQFAAQQNIAPGIVVGRLQKFGKIPWEQFNDLKGGTEWIQ